MSSLSSSQPQTISLEAFDSTFGLNPHLGLWDHDWECPSYVIKKPKGGKDSDGREIIGVSVNLRPTFTMKTNGSRNGHPEHQSSGIYQMDPDFARRWTESFAKIVSFTRYQKKPKTLAAHISSNIHRAMARTIWGPTRPNCPETGRTEYADFVAAGHTYTKAWDGYYSKKHKPLHMKCHWIDIPPAPELFSSEIYELSFHEEDERLFGELEATPFSFV